MLVSDDCGAALVRRARCFIEESLGSAGAAPPDAAFPDVAARYRDKERTGPDMEPADAGCPDAGIFVTLKRGDQLRGCIGYVDPDWPISETLRSAAIAAAAQDPRFRPVSADEMGRITVEVTVLGSPEPLGGRPEAYPGIIKVGADGLLVKRGSASGLLLPQVPLEHNWNALEFLEYACQKAGLGRDCWKDPKVKVYRFGGDVFSEESPRGRITRM